MDIFINVWYNNNDIMVTTISCEMDEDLNDDYYKIDHNRETVFMAKTKDAAEEYINEKFNLNVKLELLYSIKAF